MTSFLVASTVLALTTGPDDFYEPPVLEIGVIPSCDGDRDCFRDTPLCNTNTGQCVECLGPEHCDEGWTCDPTGYCLDACAVDADCEGIDGRSLCDPETGTCVVCLSSEDCPAEQYCVDHYSCWDDHCVPGETFCFAGALVQCLEDGGSTMHVETCEAGCEVEDGTAACVTPPSSTGEPSGSSDGSPTAGETTVDPVSGGSSGDGDPAEDALGGRGCACRGTPAPTFAWGWLLVLGAAAARRRSSRTLR